MTKEEIDAFLELRLIMSVATINRDGRPHLVPMWYGFLEGAPALWTYGKSQKVLNLMRDPRITCLVEAGKDYEELKGVELIGKALVSSRREDVQKVGESVYERYIGPLDAEGRARAAAMGAKRVAVVIQVEKMVSWDHQKLASLEGKR